MGLRLASAPAIEPITLDEMKAHLRCTDSAENDYITALIVAARAACEAETKRAFLTQTWTLTLDRFPRCNGLIELPNPPLQSVLSIAYTDEDGVVQTLDESYYQVDAVSEPGRLAPAANCTWPDDASTETLSAVIVSYRAGWTAAASVPAEIKHAIKLLASHWYANREAVEMEYTPKTLPLAASLLLSHHRIF